MDARRWLSSPEFEHWNDADSGSLAFGRFTLAVLTAAGRALVTEAAPVHVAHVRQLIFDVLDETEQHALSEARTKILSKLIAGR